MKNLIILLITIILSVNNSWGQRYNGASYEHIVSVFSNQEGSLGAQIKSEYKNWYIGLRIENLHHPKEFIFMNFMLVGGGIKRVNDFSFLYGGRAGFINVEHRTRRPGVGLSIGLEYSISRRFSISASPTIDYYINYQNRQGKIINGTLTSGFLSLNYKL